MTERPQLVALRALGLGDLLTGVPALSALRAEFPEHRLVLAAPSALAPLARLSGAVDDVVDTASLGRLDPRLERADLAVNLHGKGPESHRVLLAAGPRRLLAFANSEVAETAGLPPWRAGEHEVERWCRLLGAAGIPADPDDLDLPQPTVSPPRAAAGATLLHPGAASGARRWPVERWIAIARAERAAGRDVVVTGSPDEAGTAAAVASGAGLPGSAVLAGRTSVLELTAAVGAAGRVVCGDTGVAHLATALGTPSVVLFGPTPPSEWGPPPARPRHAVLWAGVRGDPLASAPDAGLLALTPAQVLAALARL